MASICIIANRKMQQSGALVYKAQTIKQAKNDLANKIAQLNEYNCQRSQLEHRLFDLTNHAKSLKNQQYDLHKEKVNLECQRVQLVQGSEETAEEVVLGKTMITQIKEELEDNDTKSKKIVEKMASLKKKKEQLEGRIAQTGLQCKKLRKDIEEVRQKEENLKRLKESREEIIAKMKESELYLTQKLEQQQNNQAQLRRLHTQEQTRTTAIQTQTKEANTHLQQLEQQKLTKQRDIIKDQQQISSQQLRNKVLLEKIDIMKQRLAQVQEQHTCAQHLLRLKQNTAKELKQRKALQQQQWNTVRLRISLQLQYSRYSLQKGY